MQKNREIKNLHIAHKLFIVSVLLKGLDGVFELIGGLAAFFVTKSTIVKVVEALVRRELLEDPHDIVATLLLRFAHKYAPSFQTFVGIYLVSHGLIKIFIIYNLLKKRLWAYPVAIVVFSLFILYQVYAYINSPNIGLVVLTLMDVVVIALTLIEYRTLKGEVGSVGSYLGV